MALQGDGSELRLWIEERDRARQLFVRAAHRQSALLQTGAAERTQQPPTSITHTPYKAYGDCSMSVISGISSAGTSATKEALAALLAGLETAQLPEPEPELELEPSLSESEGERANWAEEEWSEEDERASERGPNPLPLGLRGGVGARALRGVEAVARWQLRHSDSTVRDTPPCKTRCAFIVRFSQAGAPLYSHPSLQYNATTVRVPQRQGCLYKRASACTILHMCTLRLSHGGVGAYAQVCTATDKAVAACVHGRAAAASWHEAAAVSERSASWVTPSTLPVYP